MDGGYHLAEHVHLQVVGGGVSHAHGPRVLVASQVFERVFSQRRDGAYAVQDARLSAVQVTLFQQPVQVPVGAVLVAQPVQDVDGETRVPEPRVAVVPVAGSADGLRQACGGGGHHRAGVAVHHQVKREERTHHRITPQARVVHSRDQPLPVAPGHLQFFPGAVAFHSRGAPVAVGEHERGGLPLPEGEARVDAALAEGQGYRGGQRHGLPAAAGLHRRVAGARPLRREGRHSARIVVAGLVVADHLDLARLALHNAMDLVVCSRRSLRIIVVVVLGRHEVRERQHAVRGGERGTQYVRVAHVGLVGGGRGRGWGDAEVSPDVRVQDGGGKRSASRNEESSTSRWSRRRLPGPPMTCHLSIRSYTHHLPNGLWRREWGRQYSIGRRAIATGWRCATIQTHSERQTRRMKWDCSSGRPVKLDFQPSKCYLLDRTGGSHRARANRRLRSCRDRA